MDDLEKFYKHFKFFMEKNGFPPTIKQMADILKIEEHEAKEVFERLRESGRIKLIEIPKKKQIYFSD